MADFRCVLTLDEARQPVSGSAEALVAATGRSADLRIGTRFRHDQHIDVNSDDSEWVDEVAEFGVTYLVEQRWAAGIMSLRQPIDLPTGFGPRPSMSFFLYNQDGQQAIARPYLDGAAATGRRGRSPDTPPPDMSRYRVISTWDAETNAPSQNFVYEFGEYRYCVRDDWQELLAHDAQGEVQSGSLPEVADGRVPSGPRPRLAGGRDAPADGPGRSSPRRG